MNINKEREMEEKRLWYELDKIAVAESGLGGNIEKANAAENLMKFLDKPTHTECREWWDREHGVRRETQKRGESMEIKTPFQFVDNASGLKIEILEDKHLNRIHIEHLDVEIGADVVANRDFYFTKDGSFDGTGSLCGE
jgi:hypothetical protein